MMEERDIRVRGYTLRLPLDVLLVATANQDYTNRGRIITPLKDRFGAEVRTHYPLDVDAEVDVVGRRPSWSPRWRAAAGDPGPVRAAAARVGGDRPAVQGIGPVRGGGSETVAAARFTVRADRRGARGGPAGRPAGGAVGTARQTRVRAGEEETELVHLLRRAVAETARDRFAGLDLQPLADAVAAGHLVRPASVCRPATCWPRCPSCRSCTTWPPAPGPIPRRIRRAGSRPRSSWRWALPVQAAGQGRRRREHGVRRMTAEPSGWSYGPWHDGPDPLAPPVDLREALDALGRDVMEVLAGQCSAEMLRGLRDQRA